jgi:hypothetical protein
MRVLFVYGGEYVDGVHFHVRRRPGSVAAIAAQLLRERRKPRAPSRGQDSPEHAQAGLRRAGAGVREPLADRVLSAAETQHDQEVQAQ